MHPLDKINTERLTIRDVREGLGDGCSAVALAERHYTCIEETDLSVHAWLWLSRERALERAERVDVACRAGGDAAKAAGPLAGVPIGIKDVLVMQGAPATAGSKILEGYEPPYDATVVKRLDAAGAVMLGKLNCDEFAMGSSNENSAYGPVHNPRSLKHVPGGSSGGSAAAVAAGMCVASLGSDTGGSIRQPASFCGVVGVLPTYGRVSRYGLIAFASSLDRVGPFARNVRDAATMLGVIAGPDECDATCSTRAVPDYVAELERPVEGLRLGVPEEYFGEGLDAEVRAAVEDTIRRLGEQGCVVKPVSLKHTRYAIPTYYVIATAEASANLARFDGVRYGYRAPADEAKTLSEMYRKTRDEGFGAEVKRRIMLGTYVLSAGYYDAYYKKAQQVRRLITQDYVDAFKEVDAIVTPTTPTPAFLLGEKADDPIAMYLADIFTVTASLAGICGISVPCGKSKTDLPIGLQILGKHFDESTVFRVAQMVEDLQ
jgi:aspartyl-tRNA(Asn)/glutamyl-tRNA(Gln) amidotransferase subunit A